MTTLTKPKVTSADLLWVAWRGHRTLILATAALTAAIVASVLWSTAMAETWTTSLPGVYFRIYWQPREINLLFGAAIAVFWGAPLVAREYEARTNLVAWGQDVSATRWLTGQVVLLGAVASCLAAVVWLSQQHMTSKIRELSGNRYTRAFTDWFEVAPQLQIGYALFGFALGVAAGVLVRRTLPAMGIALVGFGVVRVAVMEWARVRILPPVHTFEAWSPPGVEYVRQVPEDALYIASGYADANGVRMVYPEVCQNVADTTACVKANGVAGHYAEFQPIERLELFQWIETGIFLVLAAGLLVLAWYWVKRARRV